MNERLQPMNGSVATLFPLMSRDQPDTAERKRLEMQAIPFALPKRREEADGRDPVR